MKVFSKSIVNHVGYTSNLETSLVYQLRSTWVFYDKTALGEIDVHMKLKPGSSSRIRTRAMNVNKDGVEAKSSLSFGRKGPRDGAEFPCSNPTIHLSVLELYSNNTKEGER